MKIESLLIVATMLASFSTGATDFRSVRLDNESHNLTILKSDGTAIVVPKMEGQDGFSVPRISSDHLYAGWLALYPGEGASYSQPLDLVVIDTSGKSRDFFGDFGMVFNWCFVGNKAAIVYRFQFPHGLTPVGFEMQSLGNHKLIHRFVLKPNTSRVPDSEVLRMKAPAWTRCAQS